MPTAPPPPADPGERHRLASAPVLVGVDGSAASWLALRWAAAVASSRHRELLVVHGLRLDTARAIMAGWELLLPQSIEDLHHRGAQTMVTARELVKELHPALRVTTKVSADGPARLLVERSADAYMTVIGASLDHPGIGSTREALTRHGSGTVVIVRDTGTERQIRERGPVVVGVDGSPTGEAAIAAAFEEAAARDADLVAVHVWSDLSFGEFLGPPDSRRLPVDFERAELAILAERLAGWQEKYPDVQVVRKVYPASPFGTLLAWSQSAQLIVVGCRGRGGFAGLLLGSTANSLIRHSHCPVMVAHGGCRNAAARS